MRRLHRCAAFAAFALLAASSPVLAASVCHRLDVPGSTWTQLWQINDSGQIAAGWDGGGSILAAGAWTPLPPPPATSGYRAADLNALGLNDSGQVAGVAFDAAGNGKAFTLQGDTYRFFVDAAAGAQAEARSLSNGGLVTGLALDTNIGWVFNPSNAGVGYAAGFTTLAPTLPDGSPAGLVIPGALNDSGVLVGSAWFFGRGGRHGFVYDPRKAQPYTVFLVPGGEKTAARGINSRGTIVGFLGVTGSASHPSRIYVLRDGQYQYIDCSDLLAPGEASLYAESINDSELITAGFADASGNLHGALVYPQVSLPVAGVYSARVDAGAPIGLGASLAHGYRFAVEEGSPHFASVVLPVDVGVGAYKVKVKSQVFTIAAGERLDFTRNGFPDGVASFRLLDVDPVPGLADSATAFVAQVSFAQTGSYTGTVKLLCTAAGSSKDAGCH